jgi:hypothetical protein
MERFWRGGGRGVVGWFEFGVRGDDMTRVFQVMAMMTLTLMLMTF